MYKNIRLRLLSYIVMAYMLMAFAWWSVLLFTKNNDAFEAKAELLRIGMAAEGLYTNEAEFQETERYLSLKQQYDWQEWMILGEAGVFVVTLLIGVWLINRGYRKEVYAAKQQRNFLLSITHELKSPIASIRLIIETCMRRKLSREQIHKLSQNALKETERLNTLVSNLLLSAKLETAYQIHREELDLSVLIRELVTEMNEKFPEANFTFDEPSAVPHIRGDRPGLTSVVTNLLENAVKYSPDDSCIKTRLSQTDTGIRLDVIDEGYGVPEKEKKHIFEKFYRVGNEDTRKTKGTGLGLYIVKQIVLAHKGTIQVLDNEPKGTIFRVEIPFSIE